MSIPYHYIRPVITDIAIRARTRGAETERTLHVGIGEIDAWVFQQAINKTPPEARNCVRYATSGGALAADVMYRIGQANSPACKDCGCDNQTIDHLERLPSQDLPSSSVIIHLQIDSLSDLCGGQFQ